MRVTTTLAIFFLLGLLGCSDSKEYKIKFDNVDWLKVSDPVLFKGLVVGEVRKMKVDVEAKILVTIDLHENFKITKPSRFIIKPELIGGKYIDIELADSRELMDEKEIQIGQVQPYDTTRVTWLTKSQYDSIIKIYPGAKIADSIIKVLRNAKEDKLKESDGAAN